LDHCHEKLDNKADYTEFIKHVQERIDIVSYDDEITPDDSTSISRERSMTDYYVTLPEKIRKLIFYLYTLS